MAIAVFAGGRGGAGRLPRTEFEAALARAGARLLRPARKGVERHGVHTPEGVAVRVLQRLLALTAAIWHNDRSSQPIKRSLVAYDH